MNINLLKLISVQPIREKLTIDKRLIMFAGCLVIASIFWILTVLNRQYNYPIQVPIIYANIPESKVFSKTPLYYLTLDAKAQGWDLVIYNFYIAPAPIIIDLAKHENINYFSTKSKFNLITEQIPSKIKILSISPDSLFFDFENKITKRVPIVIDAAITFAKQYDLSGNIILNPDSIYITGPESVVSTIKETKTERFVLSNLSQSANKVVNILSFKNQDIIVSERSISLTIPIDKFTENSIEVPIEVIRTNEENNIKIFPDKASLTFQVPLSKYEKTTSDLFKVVVNYSFDNNYADKLEVKLVQFPSFVKSITITPKQVDYLLVKK